MSDRVPQESDARYPGERKRLEEAAQASDERFRTLVQLSFDVYWETDAEHRFTRQDFAPTLLNAPAPGSEIGKTRWEVPYLEPDEEAWRRHRATLAAHLPFRDFELARPTAGGGTRHVSVSGFPVFDEDGRFLGYRGVGRDITQRKRAEAQHQAHLWFLQSMDRISRAMQGTHEPERMVRDVLDATIDIFSCDRAWLLHPRDPQLTMWRADMARTRPPFPAALAPGTDLPCDADLSAVFTAAQASGDPVPVLPAPLADRYGIRSHLAVALHPKEDHPYLFCLHQCLQARSWTDDEQRLFREIGGRLADALGSLLAIRNLRDSERRLEAAQRIAHVGWWERDYRTGRVSLSDEASRIFGVEPVDMPQWHGRWLGLIHPDDRAQAAAASEAALRGGPRYDVEYRVVRPDGTLRMVHSQGDVTSDESGRPILQFGVMQDITEQTLAQERLRQQEHALQTARSELAHVSRLTTLGELTSSIVHEVSQPLGGMITGAGACARWLAAEPPGIAEARAALDNIAADGKRAREVIARIRALTRRQMVRKDNLDINQELLEVLALTEHESRSHGITRRTELDRTLPRVPADRIQLQQVLLNLIVNAIEAMSAVDDRPRLLTLVSRHDSPNDLRVEVRDTGSGLDPQRIEQVFEAFYTTKADGIGIGLSISRSIVEAHGGRLWASRNEPHGAVFQLSLPVAQEGQP